MKSGPRSEARNLSGPIVNPSSSARKYEPAPALDYFTSSIIHLAFSWRGFSSILLRATKSFAPPTENHPRIDSYLSPRNHTGVAKDLRTPLRDFLLPISWFTSSNPLLLLPSPLFLTNCLILGCPLFGDGFLQGLAR